MPPSSRWLLQPLILLLGACATAPAPHVDGHLPACPMPPRCASSDEGDLPPLRAEDLDAAWQALARELAARPRTRIASQDADTLAAETRTPLMGYTDDLLFQRRPTAGFIAMRSASRIGWWDWGTNQRRLEDIRAAVLARLAAGN